VGWVLIRLYLIKSRWMATQDNAPGQNTQCSKLLYNPLNIAPARCVESKPLHPIPLSLLAESVWPSPGKNLLQKHKKNR
jgi:hypothetical protein